MIRISILALMISFKYLETAGDPSKMFYFATFLIVNCIHVCVSVEYCIHCVFGCKISQCLGKGMTILDIQRNA